MGYTLHETAVAHRSRVESSHLVESIVVFDEFFQVDDLASTKYRGSGLGLSLVRDLVGLLEGSISMRSDVGEGSTFTVRIPVEPLG